MAKKREYSTKANASAKKRNSKQQVSKKKINFTPPHPTVVAASIVILLALLFLFFVLNDFPKPSLDINSAKIVEVEIAKGSSARQIANLLEKEGVVLNAKGFERYLELSGNSTRLQAGSYTFTVGMDEQEVTNLLVNGPQSLVERVVTIYPGDTIKKIDQRLVELNIAKEGEFIEATNDIATKNGLSFSEGWFLSGTFTVTSAYQLASQSQQSLNEAVAPYLGQLEKLDLSLSDVIKIASLIQGETNDVLQMGKISQVIYNRLKLNMPIGIDASLRYNLDAWNRELTTKELNSDNPYNMRIVTTLPPTPICAPSIASIDAAFNPVEGPWLFYIHDKEGNLHLTNSYEEHLLKIERYLK